MKTYKSCYDLPILNFMLMLDENALKYLIHDVEEQDDKDIAKYVKSNQLSLKELSSNISNEYGGLTFSKKQLKRQKELVTIMFLEAKHNAITKILNIFIETQEFKVLDLLEKVDMKIDLSKELIPQIKAIRAKAKAIKNNINIKTINFKKKYNINNLEEETQDTRKQLDRQALALEGNLETGYRIDIKKTSVLRWINLNEKNEEVLTRLNK